MTEKLRESALSVMPIAAIVSVMCLCVIPTETDLLLSFLVGTAFIILGMGLFSLGAEQSMTPIGNKIGTALTKTKKMGLILAVSFVLGVAITVAEPDLQVLADTVPHIDSRLLLITVGAGVGFFMSVCMFRIITGASLRMLLVGCYALIFILAAFCDADFLGVAFDSGGVTTGPMTVPFILAMGVGVSNIRSDRRAEADSFGLVALCSVGPILSVLLLGFFSTGSDAVADLSRASFADSTQVGRAFLSAIPEYMAETATALLPVVTVFLLFQIILIRMSRRSLAKILIGIFYTYAGLVLFLCGVNVGFGPVGTVLGRSLAQPGYKWLLVPIGMLIGFFIVKAEPAIQVLNRQIQSVTSGAISARAMNRCLSIGVSVSVGLAMLRVVTGIPIAYILIPGYALALGISFVVPPIFVGIAFDSGGVASGPMTTTFLLPLSIGACEMLGGNVMTDAFGVVALVALTPLIAVQLMGVAYRMKMSRVEKRAAPAFDGRDEIVELEEEWA